MTACWCSSGVEQWFCKPLVGGSNPSTSYVERFPSGQRGQTVNLLADVFVGSNPTLSTLKLRE